MNIQIRPAILDDVPAIVELVAANARKGGLLPRSGASIRAALHNFSVAIMEGEARAKSQEPRPENTDQRVQEAQASSQESGAENANENLKSKIQNLQRVVGCGSLLPMNTTLVELRSLAVDETIRGAGIGQKLVVALVEEAKRRKFGTIFALTRAV